MGARSDQSAAPDREHPNEMSPDDDAVAERRRRWLGVAAAALLGLATVGTAWGSYQSARWGGVVSSKSSESIRLSTDAGKAYQEADARFIQDSNVFLAWALAVEQGDDGTADYLQAELFSPALSTAVPLWLAMDDRPHSPLELETYTVDQFEIAQFLDILSSEVAAEATDANEVSDDYVLLTVILASVLFLAGLSGTTRTLRLRAGLVAGSAVVLGLAAMRMLTYPVL